MASAPEPPGAWPSAYLQTYVEAESFEAALVIAAGLISYAQPFAEVCKCEIEPYWKIAGWMGVCLTLRNLDAHGLSTAMLPGCKVGGDAQDPWYVWDHRLHDASPAAPLRWANLERLQPPQD